MDLTNLVADSAPRSADTPVDDDLVGFAQRHAESIGLSPDLAARQMAVESGGNASAVSPKGAFGPMQLMPATARELEQKYGGNAKDPRDNIRLGQLYYRDLVNQFGGDATAALAAYNYGPGAVNRAMSQGGQNWMATLPDETQRYIAAIRGTKPAQPMARAVGGDMMDVGGLAIDPDRSLKTVEDDLNYSPLSAGFKRGAIQSQALAAGVAGLIGDSLGVDSVKNSCMEVYRQKMQESQKYSRDASFSDVMDGKVGAANWLFDNAGYLGYQALEGILTGGAGAILGKTLGKQAVAATVAPMVEREVGKLAVARLEKAGVKDAAAMSADQLSAAALKQFGEKGAADLAQQAATNVAGNLGTATGLFANNLRMEGGSIYGDAADDKNTQGRLGQIWMAALGASMVDTVADKVLLDRALGKADGFTGNYLSRVGKEAATQGAVQGGTEAAQTVIEQLGAGKQVGSPDSIRDIVDSTVAGALGGPLFAPAGGLHQASTAPKVSDSVAQQTGALLAAASKPDSPLARAAVVGLAAKESAQATPALDAPTAGQDAPAADPFADRLAAVDSQLNGAMQAMRQTPGFGDAGAKELVEAFALARNRSQPARLRESLLSQLERRIEAVQQRPNFTMPEQPSDVSDQAEPQAGTALAPMGSRELSAQPAPDLGALGRVIDGEARDVTPDGARDARPALGAPVARLQDAAQQDAGEAKPAAPGGATSLPFAAADNQTPGESGDVQEAARGDAPALLPAAPAPSEHDVVQPMPQGQPSAPAVAETSAEPAASGETPLPTESVSHDDTPAGLDYADWKKATGRTQFLAAGTPAQQAERAEYLAYRQRTELPAVTSDVDAAAHEAATSPLNDKEAPSAEQKEAGEYAKGRVEFTALKLAVDIENPAGSVREGTDSNGQHWRNVLRDHYGDVVGTHGADGDPLDVFIVPGLPSDWKGDVFVINQKNEDGSFDEHKCVIGAGSQEEAEAIYRRNYTPGWDGVLSIAQFKPGAFKLWSKRKDLKGTLAVTPGSTSPAASQDQSKAAPSLRSESAHVFGPQPVEHYILKDAASNSVLVTPPPGKPFSPEDIDGLVAWIRGAGWSAIREGGRVRAVAPSLYGKASDFPKSEFVSKRNLAAQDRLEKSLAAQASADSRARDAANSELGKAVSGLSENIGPHRNAELVHYIQTGETKQIVRLNRDALDDLIERGLPVESSGDALKVAAWVKAKVQEVAPADSTKSKPNQETQASSGKDSGESVAENGAGDQESAPDYSVWSKADLLAKMRELDGEHKALILRRTEEQTGFDGYADAVERINREKDAVAAAYRAQGDASNPAQEIDTSAGSVDVPASQSGDSTATVAKPDALDVDRLSMARIDGWRDAAKAGDYAGWGMVDDPGLLDGRVLMVSRHSNKLAAFDFDERSGTDHQRARVRAIAWAQANEERAPETAQHQDPGKPAEAVTPAVVAESVQKSAARTPMNIKEARQWILDAIDEAIAAVDNDERRALEVDALEARKPTTVRFTKEQVRRAMVSMNLSSAESATRYLVERAESAHAAKSAAATEKLGFVTFDVPGDGKFKVANGPTFLRDFRRKVENSAGFSGKDDSWRPKHDAPMAMKDTERGMTANEAGKLIDEARKSEDLNELGNAVELSRQFGIKEDAALDRFREVSGRDYDGWRAEQATESLPDHIPDATKMVAPATVKPDMEFRQDGVFTQFLPNTPEAEQAWRQMAADTDGTGKVLNVHAESVIQQLRDAGYTVGKAEPVGDVDTDALAAELGLDESKPAVGDESSVSTQNEPQSATPPARIESAQVAMQPEWDSFADFWNALVDGKSGSIEDVHEAFSTLLDRAEEFKASLSKLKNDQLKRLVGPGSARPDDKKADLVSKLYDQVLARFTLNKDVPAKQWRFGENLEKVNREYNEKLRTLVNGLTAEDLAEFQAQQAKAEAERSAAKAAREQGAADPQTLEDYRIALRAKMEGGMSFLEARMSLTPEQRARFDELAGEASRKDRNYQKDQRATEVRAAGQLVDGKIIETKHTRDGYDLFVVQLSERVSTEDYRTLNEGAKKLGGWYSKFRGNGAVPGFQFKTSEAAEAFSKLAGGDTGAAQEAVQARRDAFADDKSQTAAERLTEMAERLDERADESLGRERKANTARRARFAASAEASANADKALAATMRNLASAIQNGTAKFLDRVRQKVQIERLQSWLGTAKYNELKAKFGEEYDWFERHRYDPTTGETADYAEYPTYTAFRSDLAKTGRALSVQPGTKQMGAALLKVADDVTDAYVKFAKENLHSVSTFTTANTATGYADFTTAHDAEMAIFRSDLRGKAFALQVKRGQWRVVMSPSLARERGVWQGDDDKRITLKPEFARELVEKAAEINKRAGRLGEGVPIPHQFNSTYETHKQLSAIGIETPSEFRAALREFISLREAPKALDKVKQMEREMVGRKNDGLDFFPTSPAVVSEMLDAAEIQPGMRVLEPSAGMGHIADQIREQSGVEPDVVEFSPERRELLEAKGFNVQGRDFMEFTQAQERGFTYGDVFRAPDGVLGVVRGRNTIGGDRVGFLPLDKNGVPDERTKRYENFSELEGVERRGVDSGYDRIIMNPPFSNGRDIEHVQHAYDLLKPGGRIVAIVGEGAFYRQDKKAAAFRAWLDELGGTSEKLPEGSFMDPSLPVNTSVNARMVVIDKPEGAESVDTSGTYVDDAGEVPMAADGPQYSLRDTPINRHNQLTGLWSALAKFDDAFQLPTPTSKDMSSIAQEIDPGYRVSPMNVGFAKLKSKGKASAGWIVHVPHSDVREAHIFDDGRRVWLDVSKLRPGIDAGNVIYNMAAAFAHNNGRVFIGDPAGLTPMGFYRRLENMISSALKYGTTKHLYPHAGQIDPPGYYRGDNYPDFGKEARALGLEWKEGDDGFNLNSMLMASYNAAIRHVPELKNIVYAPDSRQFIDRRTGERFSRENFRELSARLRASPGARYLGGSSTLARAALINSLVSEADPENRRGLMASFGDQLRRGELDFELGGLLYSTRKSLISASLVEHPHGWGVTMQDLHAVIDPITEKLAGRRVTLLQDGNDLPAKITDDMAARGISPDAVEGVFHNGELFLIANNLRDPDRAVSVLMHEAEHFGLRGMFGRGLDPVLMQIIRSNEPALKYAAAYAKRHSTNEHQVPLVVGAEEYLASLAEEDRAKLKGWDKFIAYVRQWLRSKGWPSKIESMRRWLDKMTDNDVELLVHQALDFWRDGGKLRHDWVQGVVYAAKQNNEAAYSLREDQGPDGDGPKGGKPFDAFLRGYIESRPLDNWQHKQDLDDAREEIERDWSNSGHSDIAGERPDFMARVYEESPELFDEDGDLTDWDRYNELERQAVDAAAREYVGEPKQKGADFSKPSDAAELLHAYLEQAGVWQNAIGGSGKSDSKYWTVGNEDLRISDHALPDRYDNHADIDLILEEDADAALEQIKAVAENLRERYAPTLDNTQERPVRAEAGRANPGQVELARSRAGEGLTERAGGVGEAYSADDANSNSLRFSIREAAPLDFSDAGRELSAGEAIQQIRDPKNWLGRVADRLAGSEHFGLLDRSVHTQLHKAAKNPQFRRVMEALERKANAANTAALAASELAPGVLPKIDTVGGLKESIKAVWKGRENAADSNAAFDVLMRGTLADVTYDSAEEAGLTPVQFELYGQYRAAINESLERTAQAEAFRSLRPLLDAADQVGVRECLEREPAKARDLLSYMVKQAVNAREAEWSRARDEMANEMPWVSRFTDSGDWNAVLDEAARRSEFDELSEQDAKARERLIRHALSALRAFERAQDVAEKQEAIFKRADELKANGYAPLMRFGDNYLDAYRIDPNGEQARVFFGLFESENERDAAFGDVEETSREAGDVVVRLGARDSSDVRAEKIRAAQAANPGRPVLVLDAGTKSADSWKLYRGVNPETVALFAQSAGLDENEAYQEWIRKATANRSALKRLIARKKVRGFSMEGSRVLASFLTSNGRRVAQLMHDGEVAEALSDDAWPRHMGAEKDEAIKLKDYVEDPREEVAGPRALLFAHFLGGSISNFFINATQPAMVTLPWLTQYVGATKAASLLKDAYGLHRKPEQMSEALQEALKRADQAGVVGANEVFHLFNETARPVLAKLGDTALGRGITKAFGAQALEQTQYRLHALSQLWASPFALAENINRRVSFISGYNAALAQGKSQDEAYQMGVDCVRETQFVYGKTNRPNWARGSIGAMVFTFKTFSISYVEGLIRMARNGPEGRKAAALGLTMLALAAGANGLPGSDDLDDLIDTLMQMLGYNWQTKAKKRELLNDLIGKTATTMFLNGPLSTLTGMDVSGRFGLGNLIPGTAMFKPSEKSKEAQLAEFIGPTGGVMAAYVDAADALQMGNYRAAMRSAMPKALRDLAQGIEMATTGEYRDTKGRKTENVDGFDAFVKSIGFQPRAIGEASKTVNPLQQLSGLRNKVESDLADEWAQMVRDKKPNAAATMKAKVDAWNARNPDTPIVITPRQILGRVAAMEAGRKGRVLKAAPREMKETTADMLNED